MLTYPDDGLAVGVPAVAGAALACVEGRAVVIYVDEACTIRAEIETPAGLPIVDAELIVDGVRLPRFRTPNDEPVLYARPDGQLGAGTPLYPEPGQVFGLVADELDAAAAAREDADAALTASLAAEEAARQGADAAEAAARVAAVSDVADALAAHEVLAGPAVHGGVIPLAQRGAAAGVATLDGNGHVPSTQLPAIALVTRYVVNSEAEMLALPAQEGDVAIRLDSNRSYMLGPGDPTLPASWQELLSPLDAVQSIDGRIGVVNLADRYDELGAADAARADAEATADAALDGHEAAVNPHPAYATDADLAAHAAAANPHPGSAPLVVHAIANVAVASGAAVQVDPVSDRFLVVPVTLSPTAIAGATCLVELSPNGIAWTPIWTETVPLGLGPGHVRSVRLSVPAGWRVRLTTTNGELGQGRAW